MKRKVAVFTMVVCLISSINLLARSKFKRFSSNPIGKLNVVGIAMSEDVLS